MESLKKEHYREVRSLKQENSTLSSKLKHQSDSLSSLQIHSRHEREILNQKLEFIEQHTEELRTQLENEHSKNSYLLRTLRTSNSSPTSDEIENQLLKLKDKFLSSLDRTNEEKHIKIGQELQDAKEQYSLLEYESSTSIAERNNTIEALKGSLNEATEEIGRILSESNSFKLESSSEARQLHLKIKELECLNEELSQHHSLELAELTNQSEGTHEQLRAFFDSEKQRLESKLTDERERFNRKYSSLCEEHEDRLRQELETYEYEATSKANQIIELQAIFTGENDSLRREKGLDRQKIGVLERELQDAQNDLGTIRNSHLEVLAQLEGKMSSEKQVLAVEIGIASTHIAGKDNKLSSVATQLTKSLKLKETQSAEERTVFLKEKELLLQRISNLKANYQTISDEYTAKKSEYKTDLEHCQQQIENTNRKTRELEQELRETRDNYEESIQQLKDHSGYEQSALASKLSKDKETLENKLEIRRNSAKEQAKSSARQIHALGLEKTSLTETLSQAKTKKRELRAKYLLEIQSLQSALQCSPPDPGEATQLNNTIHELQLELREKDAVYERERALWDDKCQFLVLQRDQARAAQVEFQRKYDSALALFQQKGGSPRSGLQHSTDSLVNSIETLYKAQLAALQGAHDSKTQAANHKTAALTQQVASLQSSLTSERQRYTAETASLRAELGTLKSQPSEQDMQLNELLTQHIKERALQASEHETRLKENESRLVHLHEKEKTKWLMEKDRLLSQKSQTADQLERARRKYETLCGEHEKLQKKVASKRSNSKQSLSRVYAAVRPTFEEFHRQREGSSQATGTPNKQSSPFELRSRQRSETWHKRE